MQVILDCLVTTTAKRSFISFIMSLHHQECHWTFEQTNWYPGFALVRIRWIRKIGVRHLSTRRHDKNRTSKWNIWLWIDGSNDFTWLWDPSQSLSDPLVMRKAKKPWQLVWEVDFAWFDHLLVLFLSWRLVERCLTPIFRIHRMRTSANPGYQFVCSKVQWCEVT